MTVHVLPCLSIHLDPIVWSSYIFCVYTQKCTQMLCYSLLHWQLIQLLKNANKKTFCTCAFAKGESFQHITLNVSVYFHGHYYNYTWVPKVRILCFFHISLNYHISNCPGKQWMSYVPQVLKHTLHMLWFRNSIFQFSSPAKTTLQLDSPPLQLEAQKAKTMAWDTNNLGKTAMR